MRVACVGVGLIGASIAARIRQVRPDVELVGCDDVLPGLGFVRTHSSKEVAAALADSDLAIIALPPSVLLSSLPALLASLPEHAVMVDVCSVKAPVHEAAKTSPKAARFVGGHPMIGSERSGAEHRNPSWLIGAKMALTQTCLTAPDAIGIARDFFSSLGCEIYELSPDAHDAEVARTSHVPQLVSTALAALTPEHAQMVGPALRDLTRLASSPLPLWNDVLALNQTQVSHALDDLIAHLQRLRDPSTRAPEFALGATRKKQQARVAQGRLSDRVAVSATGAFSERVAARRQRGYEVYAFNVGEPAMPLAPEWRQLLDEAFKKAPIVYTKTAGSDGLRHEVALLANAVTQHPRTAEQVVVTNGAKQAIHLALASLLSPGDEVLLPVPAWVSFPELIRLAGGVPVATSHDLTDLERHITHRTKAILLNSPNNPTGAIYSEQQLAALSALAQRHHLFVLSDELYRCFSFTRPHASPLLSIDPERAVWFDGVSKSHGLTGMRMGWAVAPTSLVSRMVALASQETSCANSTSQYLAEVALRRYPNGVPALLQATSDRRQWLLPQLDALSSELSVPLLPDRCDGAFYAWIDISDLLSAEQTTEAWCNELLDQTGVALMYGDAFGAPGFVRLAYATSEEILQEGFARFRQHLLRCERRA